VVIDQVFNIAHNLSVSLMSSLGHSDQSVIVFIICGGWLRMENKRDGKEALENAPLASESLTWLLKVRNSTLIHSIW
jgi:hypothetical protein